MYDVSPPNLRGLNWRPFACDDLAALGDLAAACHLADGGLSFMIEPDNLKSRYFPDAPGLVWSTSCRGCGEISSQNSLLRRAIW